MVDAKPALHSLGTGGSSSSFLSAPSAWQVDTISGHSFRKGPIVFRRCSLWGRTESLTGSSSEPNPWLNLFWCAVRCGCPCARCQRNTSDKEPLLARQRAQSKNRLRDSVLIKIRCVLSFFQIAGLYWTNAHDYSTLLYWTNAHDYSTLLIFKSPFCHHDAQVKWYPFTPFVTRFITSETPDRFASASDLTLVPSLDLGVCRASTKTVK
jgi:hypothetical protein